MFPGLSDALNPEQSAVAHYASLVQRYFNQLNNQHRFQYTLDIVDVAVLSMGMKIGDSPFMSPLLSEDKFELTTN